MLELDRSLRGSPRLQAAQIHPATHARLRTGLKAELSLIEVSPPQRGLRSWEEALQSCRGRAGSAEGTLPAQKVLAALIGPVPGRLAAP